MLDKDFIVSSHLHWEEENAEGILCKMYNCDYHVEFQSDIPLEVFDKYTERQKLAYNSQQPLKLTKKIFDHVYDEVIIELLTIKQSIEQRVDEPEIVMTLNALIDKVSLRNIC